MNEHHSQPLLIARRGFSFFLFFLSLYLIGCSGSSPRFAGSQKSEQKKEQKKKGSIRFSSKVIEEETREDDKKVDVNAVAGRFSSARTPAAPEKKNIEKNDVVKPDITPVPSGKFENQKMMDLILTWMGTPYEYGAATKAGTDCSGFTMQMFKQSAGMELPRTTEEQVKLGKPVDLKELQFGDLIFFNTTGTNPSHVGIYIGDDMFAHASVSFGVTLSSMYSSYYKKRYTEARRIVQ